MRAGEKMPSDGQAGDVMKAGERMSSKRRAGS
jgi:hypothetical protein